MRRTLLACFTASVCLRLPSVNACLLRHLMCVLYHIAERSSENSMNAYNLAVCVSQSLLWSAASLEASGMQELRQQSESMEKVPKVVQYMIEHCVELFGDDCIKLFGEQPATAEVAAAEAAASKQRGDSSTDSDSINSILGPSYTQTGQSTVPSCLGSGPQLHCTCIHVHIKCAAA